MLAVEIPVALIVGYVAAMVLEALARWRGYAIGWPFWQVALACAAILFAVMRSKDIGPIGRALTTLRRPRRHGWFWWNLAVTLTVSTFLSYGMGWPFWACFLGCFVLMLMLVVHKSQTLKQPRRAARQGHGRRVWNRAVSTSPLPEFRGKGHGQRK